MATVHPPPPRLALLPAKPPQHAGADADVLDDNDSDGESVAESCPWPEQHNSRGHAAPAETEYSCGSSTCCHDEEDDGCRSCVEGDECSGYYYDDEGVENVAGSGVWWQRLAVSTTRGGGDTFPDLPVATRSTQEVKEEQEDPKRAAERQEEDRKFWEHCLTSGYP